MNGVRNWTRFEIEQSETQIETIETTEFETNEIETTEIETTEIETTEIETIETTEWRSKLNSIRNWMTYETKWHT